MSDTINKSQEFVPVCKTQSKLAKRSCHESSWRGLKSQEEDGKAGQENLSASGLVLFLLLHLMLLCQYWLLPATHFTSHQGQGGSEKVSTASADWPGWPHSGTGGQWASWRTWCDTHCPELPPYSNNNRQKLNTSKKEQRKSRLSKTAASDMKKVYQMFF